MEPFKRARLIHLPENAVHEIRKIHNLEKPGRMDEAVDILEQWIQKQDHFLKKDFQRDYLEMTIIATKGSVEKAKKQIDRLCTMKTLLPHFFTKTNVKAELHDMLDVASSAFLPAMAPDFYRVLLVKGHDKIINEKHILGYYQYTIIQAEYFKAHDYFNGIIAVYDFQQINILDLVTKINPVLLQQYMSILIKGFGARWKGIYLLTQSKFIDLFTKLIKQFLSQKISDRVHVIKTLEELHEVVPKDILPIEYGGKERSLDQLIVDWVDELSTEEHVKYMEMINKAGTNESLRQSCHFNQEYMGTPGSFRNMTVD